MSPLKVTLLLRLAVYCDPFEATPIEQVHAPAMRQAFRDFANQGLLADGVTHQSVLDEPPAVMGSPWVHRLSEKGQRLFHAICAINPEDV